MMKLLSNVRRKAERPVVNTVRRMDLTRSFVETGDPRCPVAGVWTRLVEVDALAEDADLHWPVMTALPAWRALLAAYIFGKSPLRPNSTAISHLI